MNNLISVDFGALEGIAAPTVAGQNVGALVGSIVALVIPLAGIAMLFYLIFAGFQYMNAQGDPKGIAQAQQSITYAVVGFVVVFAAYTIAAAFGIALGLPQLQSLFGS